MSFVRIAAVILRQVFLLRRSLGRIFGVFFWSTVELFVWGILTIYLNSAGAAAFNFTTMFLGALIFWNFFLRSQQNISLGFLEDVWARNLANLFGSPITVQELLVGLIINSFFLTFLTIAFVGSLAWLLFSFNILAVGTFFIPFMLVLLMFGTALGIITTAILLRYGPAAEVLSWSIAFLLQPVAAVFYPVSAMPQSLQYIARALPITYVFEGMRASLLGQHFDSRSLIFALILAVLYIAVSGWIFLKAFRVAKREGYLVHYSTESF